MERVAQTDTYGCAIACVAMVTGQRYDDVRALLKTDLNEVGVRVDVVRELLRHYRYASSETTSHDYLTGTDRLVWPPMPTAPVHLVAIELPTAIGRELHLVVWETSSNRVFDPASPGDWLWYGGYADFAKVLYVLGVYPFSV